MIKLIELINNRTMHLFFGRRAK